MLNILKSNFCLFMVLYLSQITMATSLCYIYPNNIIFPIFLYFTLYLFVTKLVTLIKTSSISYVTFSSRFRILFTVALFISLCTYLYFYEIDSNHIIFYFSEVLILFCDYVMYRRSQIKNYN